MFELIVYADDDGGEGEGAAAEAADATAGATEEEEAGVVLPLAVAFLQSALCAFQ